MPLIKSSNDGLACLVLSNTNGVSCHVNENTCVGVVHEVSLVDPGTQTAGLWTLDWTMDWTERRPLPDAHALIYLTRVHY